MFLPSVMIILRNLCGLWPFVFALAADAQFVDIEVGSPSPDDDYLTWAPVNARVRVKPGIQVSSPALEIRNADPAVGGQLWFGGEGEAADKETLSIPLPAADPEGWIEFRVAGKFKFPSFGKKDAVIQVVEAGGSGNELGRLETMVRVRKNANSLTEYERRLFLEALKTFRQKTNPTTENFGMFHEMHTGMGNFQAHDQPAFLPWHRALLLHLERRLQQIDPHVTLPYWRFDQPARNVFTEDFMGASGGGREVLLSGTNPLYGWKIQRFTGFAADEAPGITSQRATMALGTSFPNFSRIERGAHGAAHRKAAGENEMSWLFDGNRAAKDPLFFLLHCNVDRLWARWQLINGRFGDDEASYRPLGQFSVLDANYRIGAYSDESMWPWNDVTDDNDDFRRLDDRPKDAPGGPVPTVAGVVPTPAPTPGEMLDYLGLVEPGNQLGFCYDDIGRTTFLDND